MRRWGVVAIALVCSVMPLTSRAHEIQPGLGFGVRYDSNLFGVDYRRNVVSEESFAVNPMIRASHHRGALRYDLQYKPVYQAFVHFDQNNGWNHFATADVSYEISPTTSISFRDRLADTRANFLSDEFETDIGIERRLANTATLSLRHLLSPRTSAAGTASYTYFAFDDPLRADGQTFSGSLSARRQMTKRNQLGIGVTAILQEFQDTPVVTGSFTQSYQAFLSWLFVYSPTLTIGVNGGPVVIVTDFPTPPTTRTVAKFPGAVTQTAVGLIPIDSCGTIPGTGLQSLPQCNVTATNAIIRPDLTTFPSPNATINDVLSQPNTIGFVAGAAPPPPQNERFTFFGGINVTKEWTRTFSTTLYYRRSQREATSQGTSQILDTVSLSGSWRPTRRWDVNVSGSWNRSQSATPFNQLVTVVTPCATCTGLDATGASHAAAMTSNLFLFSSKNAIDITQWLVVLHARRNLARDLDLFFDASYLQQLSKGELQNKGDVRRWRAGLSFRVWLDPLELF